MKHETSLALPPYADGSVVGNESLTWLQRPQEVLLVEDNVADVRLVEEALKPEPSSIHLAAVWDGEEAVSFLRREGPYATAAQPDLILLDLNLPRRDGHRVLAMIKQHREWRRIPVIVLTNSEADQDIQRAYDLGANCYLCKSLSLAEFFRMIHALTEFWLGYAKLPSR